MKSIISLLLIVLLASCYNDAKEVSHNGDFKLELLFEQEGCKMYRFYDGGRYIYWSTCEGKTSYHTGDKSHRNIQAITTDVYKLADTAAMLNRITGSTSERGNGS